MKKTDLIKVLILSSPCLSLNASEVDIPHNFTAGTAALASEVNANFNALETAVDDNHQKIVAMQAEIDALEAENQSLQSAINTLQNAQPSTVAMPISPRGTGPTYSGYALDEGRGVFTIEFNVNMNPDSFVADNNVIVSGAGGTGSGSISWRDGYSTMVYSMLEDFITISPCGSGGLQLDILGTGETAVQDMNDKAMDGDRDGVPGGDLSITYEILC